MQNAKTVKEIRKFNRFYTNILGLVDRHILDSSYSLTETRILYEIFHTPRCTARKIKNLLLVDEGYLSRTIDKLSKQGLIIRERSREDARVHNLSLSEKGAKEFLKLNEESEKSIEAMIEHLPRDNIGELESVFHRVQELLDKQNNAAQIKLEDIRIRNTLTQGDLGYVIHLHGELYGTEYGYGIEFETYVARGIHEFYKNYDPQKDRVWICEHNDKIVGFLLLMHRENDAAQLRYFLVKKEYRGIGLGNKLMELFMDFLYECRYQSAYLWTTHELNAAASLYKKYGFILTEEKESMAFNKPLREQRYDLVVNR